MEKSYVPLTLQVSKSMAAVVRTRTVAVAFQPQASLWIYILIAVLAGFY